MKRKLTIRRTVCSIVAALLAAAAVWLLCRWVGYDLQLRVGDTQTFAILNDDYSQVIDVTGEGLTQSMPVSAGQTVYGVRLDFSTQGTPRQSGMLMVDLYDSTGTLRGQAAGDYLNIFDNLFTAFAFDSTYTPAQDETMTLHIYSVAAWDGPLGLWASTGTVDGMPLLVGDTDAGATLALQMMTDNAAQWPTTLANQLAPVLAAAAFAAVLLFGLQTPLALTVAVVGLACGLAFVQVTPALVAPDEYFHLAAAYELASRIGGQTPADEDGNLLHEPGNLSGTAFVE